MGSSGAAWVQGSLRKGAGLVANNALSHVLMHGKFRALTASPTPTHPSLCKRLRPSLPAVLPPTLLMASFYNPNPPVSDLRSGCCPCAYYWYKYLQGAVQAFPAVVRFFHAFSYLVF